MGRGKDDRRVKYTKMVLKESLIKLLEKKDITRISIKEICEEADINRSTFYSHFNDQYDLLKEIEDEIIDKINAHLDGFKEKNNSMNYVMLAERIFKYLKDNAKPLKLLLSERGDFGFQKNVMMLIYDKIINEITDTAKITKEDADYIYSFIIAGCVGIIQKWFDDDMKKSAHFMADIVIKLTMGSISILKEQKENRV